MASIAENGSIIQAINTVLPSWAETSEDILFKSIRKNKIGQSGDLESSIAHTIDLAKPNDPVGNYRLSFDESGRFVDMGVGRSHPIGSTLAANTEAIKSAGRPKKKWFAKIIYKRIYGALIRGLIVNAKESVINQAKGELN